MNERFKFKLDKDKIKLQLRDLGKKLIRKRGKSPKKLYLAIFLLLALLGYLLYYNQESAYRDNKFNFSDLDLRPPDLVFEYERHEFPAAGENDNLFSLDYGKIESPDLIRNEAVDERDMLQGVVTQSFRPVQEFQGTEFRILRPVSGDILLEPGWYYNALLDDWRYQQGIELAGNIGDIVMAAANGKVSAVKEDEYKGIMVIVEHDHGWITEYGHLERVSVSPGTILVKGQEIGRIGTTGMASQPSLYFSLRNKDGTVNPVDFFE